MCFKSLLVASVIALAGCQTSEVITQQAESSVVQSAQALSFVQAKVPSSHNVEINKSTQMLDSVLIDSPVAAFELPANRGKLEIKITSQITDSVFSPMVLVLDKQGNMIDSYDSSIFEYRRPKLVFGDRLVAEIDFYPPTGLNSVYMLVYTSKEEMEKETFTVHPGRAMAEAKGNYMPELKDIAKPHADTGTLLIEVEGSNSIVSDQPKSASPENSYKTLKPQVESADYYKSSIMKAIEEDNVSKALALLEEAKALNVEGAQETFINAINAKK